MQRSYLGSEMGLFFFSITPSMPPCMGLILILPASAVAPGPGARGQAQDGVADGITAPPSHPDITIQG